MKAKVQIVIGLLSLAGLLSYTWTHTGNLLASYVRPDYIGYLAAGGIELSIVGLSIRIGDLRKSNVNPRFFVFTLIAVVIVSALANMSEGFAVKFAEPLTLANVGKLDMVQAIVSVAATGLISLVTLALSEIVGSDVSAAAKVSQRVAVQSSRQGKATTPSVNPSTLEVSNTVELDTPTLTLEQARGVKADGDAHAKAAALDMLTRHLSSDPDATITELARLIGKSRTTVYSYLDELEQAGKVHRNGQITVSSTAQG